MQNLCARDEGPEKLKTNAKIVNMQGERKKSPSIVKTAETKWTCQERSGKLSSNI